MTVSPIPPTPDSDRPSENGEFVQLPESLSESSSAIVRSYRSPTSTLEISANPSPLERWTRKPTLKNLRFQLRFDDPKVSEDQWVTLRGDRVKLEALCGVVADYVQSFLSQSQTLVRSECAQEMGATDLGMAGIGATLSADAEKIHNLQGLALHPKGLLAHTLTLGSLASETIGDSLTLTSTQLADLASILDEHSRETIVLPVLQRNFAWTRSPAVWGKIAASTLVSLGLTATILRQFDRSPTSTPVETIASSSDQRNAPSPLPPPLPSSPLMNPPPPGGFSIPSTTNVPPNLPGASSDGSANPDSGAPSPAPSASGSSSPEKKVPVQQTMPPTKTTDMPVASGSPSSAPSVIASRSAKEAAPVPSATAARGPDNADSPDPAPPASLEQQIEILEGQVKGRWTPPTTVQKDLEYLVSVDAQGRVLEVIAEGENLPEAQAALPTPGSTIAPSTAPYKLRLVLSPDGNVRASAVP